jgi:uncharacterized membrane protein YgcG
MGVYIEEHMSGPSSARVAQTIHNQWGVGFPTQCGGTGLLLYLAIDDRQVYISRGSALTDILNDSMLLAIIEDMKPYLRAKEYGEAVQVAVVELTQLVHGERVVHSQTAARSGSDELRFKTLVGVLLTFYLAVLALVFFIRKDEWDEERAVTTKLKQIENDRARFLQGRYNATSCPICLEDFIRAPQATTEETPLLRHNINHNQEYPLGSDGERLKLLPCGHVFDMTCWNKLLPDQKRTCPICRSLVGSNLESPDNFVTGGQVITHDLYYQEQSYRLERLHHRYPDYVTLSWVNTWSDPSYNGSMCQDFCQTHSSGGGGSFGGGSSGGGVGGSW